MSAERNRPSWWFPLAGMILLAFAIGIGGGSLLAPIIGSFFGTPEETTPLDEPDNVDRRANLIAGDAPASAPAETSSQTPITPATTDTTGLLQTPARAAPPREDSRSLERRLLALDSPLTPPATEIAGRIRQDREKKRAAQTPN